MCQLLHLSFSLPHRLVGRRGWFFKQSYLKRGGGNKAGPLQQCISLLLFLQVLHCCTFVCFLQVCVSVPRRLMFLPSSCFCKKSKFLLFKGNRCHLVKSPGDLPSSYHSSFSLTCSIFPLVVVHVSSASGLLGTLVPEYSTRILALVSRTQREMLFNNLVTRKVWQVVSARLAD